MKKNLEELGKIYTELCTRLGDIVFRCDCLEAEAQKILEQMKETNKDVGEIIKNEKDQ